MLIEASFTCAYCWSENAISVDLSGGLLQEYIEDCQTCCRPNMLVISLVTGGEGADVRAERAD